MHEDIKTILKAIVEEKEIEYEVTPGTWAKASLSKTLTLLRYMASGDETYTDLRVKPITIRIGEFDVPEPLRELPCRGTFYWVVSLSDEVSKKFEWSGINCELNLLKSGFIHGTKEGAELHMKAIKSFTKKQ